MTDDAFYNDDEPDESTKKHKNSRELELLTLRNTMKSQQGRAMMWRILQRACIFNSTFCADPVTHGYNAGQRDVGLWLDTELRLASTDYYYMMLRENQNG